MAQRIVAIVQARMGSTRFPGKVMLKAADKPLIQHVLERLTKSKLIDDIVLATSEDEKNDELESFVKGLGFDVSRGSEDDVLDRYYQAAKQSRADIVVRITGDCPLIDYEVVDKVIDTYLHGDYDDVSNTRPPTFPDGLDTEVLSFEALKKAWQEAEKLYDREHVTPYIHESGIFKVCNVSNNLDLSAERWTVDEPEDYELVKSIIEDLTENGAYFGMEEILEYKNSNPEMFRINQNVARDEGAVMGTGQKLWRRAKRVIPGGNMLLSKRAEMFLPEKWPAYFSRAKGCKVWDLDDNEFIDMSFMGIGTNTLGYGQPEVDEAVRKVLEQGNMSTFNCWEEVYLAERLVEMHPWADMVRLARSGGEANAIAIRIGRAASGKEKVAFCGYHGWHDWYLAANLSDEGGLDGHLLPGLEPSGVPRGLKGTVLPFTYNHFHELKALVQQHDVGIIKMEVMRNVEPDDGFLEKVRNLATAKEIILIFDECTSGFRQTFGGLHKHYGVEPDMAVFGKALGNGYGITAVIGRKNVMEAAQSTFISSTFWTERIGPAAALKTLEVMEKTKSWDQITRTGRSIQQRWQQLADKYGLDINIGGMPAISVLTFNIARNLEYKTLITQELLKKGILASSAVYVCTEHNNDMMGRYFDALDPVFGLIQECEDGRDVNDLLEGPICHSGFERIN